MNQINRTARLPVRRGANRRAVRQVIAAVCAALAPSAALAADSWTNPFPGVRRLHRTLSNQNINALVVDLCAPGVSVRATASGERRRTVSSFGSLVGAEAAVNGDFFSFSDYSTDGPARSGGVPWGGGDHGYVAPAQFGANRVSLPPHEATGGVASWAREVVSGHPTLLAGGQPRGNNADSLCTARHPRTALGLNAARNKLYLMVVDGRAPGRAGMTCDQLISQLRGLGATDAVNLDGGGSSTMWLRGPGVVNHPSGGSQRVVANHLAIRAKGAGSAPQCAVPAARPHAFEAGFYLGLYADLRAAFGSDQGAARDHWLASGRNEGRRANTVLDPVYYLAEHPDLVSAYGANNRVAAIDHWVNAGLGEGRRSSLEFDVRWYLDHHADLRDAFGNDYGAAVDHWISSGLREGRRSSADFDVAYYLNAHPDLLQAFGSGNYVAALQHYITSGRAEGRQAIP